MRLRAARAGDAPEIATLSGQLGYPATPSQIEARLAGILSDPAHVVLVAVDAEDRAVGWLHAVIRPSLESDPFVQIAGLVVASDRRAGGIGSALVERAEAWAREAGIGLIRVRTNVVRDRAHRFYARAGYERLKTSHLFVKRLTRP